MLASNTKIPLSPPAMRSILDGTPHVPSTANYPPSPISEKLVVDSTAARAAFVVASVTSSIERNLPPALIASWNSPPRNGFDLVEGMIGARLVVPLLRRLRRRDLKNLLIL